MRDIHWDTIEDEGRRTPRAAELLLFSDAGAQAFDFRSTIATADGQTSPAVPVPLTRENADQASAAPLPGSREPMTEVPVAVAGEASATEALGCALRGADTPSRSEEGVSPAPSWTAAADRVRTASADAEPARATFDGIPLSQILEERPDVFRAFFTEYYGAGNDRNSDAWLKRVGGTTPEDYANYWYETHGRWEGYGRDKPGAAEPIDVERLLLDRPDVFRAFYEEFYGPNNDRKSPAWVDRVGGETVQDYAKYWYVTYGQKEGYSQKPLAGSAPSHPDDRQVDPEPQPPAHDPADDPWNHPALFPDWRPPYEGWEPPANIWHSTFAADPFD